MNRDLLAFAITMWLVAMWLACGGCGTVVPVHQDGDAGASSTDSMLSWDAGAELLEVAAKSDAAAEVAAADAAAEGPSCSWECRAFCDCGPLPCCRSAGAADCCTR